MSEIKKIVQPETWKVDANSYLSIAKLKEILQEIPDDTEVCVGEDYNWVEHLYYDKEEAKFSIE